MAIWRRVEWLSWFPWYRRRTRHAELEREMRDHLELEAEEQQAAGLSAQEASYAAHRALGNTLKIQEDVRAAWGFLWLETLAQDVRYALRMLRKSPGFTVVAVLTLALGIGASTAVFSLVDAVLLKPLPFPHAEKIVFPWRLPKRGVNLGFAVYPWGRLDFLFFSQQSRTFEALGAFLSDSFNLTDSGEPERLDGLRVSAGFFPSLGVSPALGRTFTDQEDRLGNEHEVILGSALWRQRFASNPEILGHAIDLNGVPYIVIGVMPPGFVFPNSHEMPNVFTFAPQTQLWVPLALDRRSTAIPYESDELAIVGRIKPGVTIAQAQADMDIMGKRLESGRRNGEGWFNSAVTPLTRQVAGNTRQPLLLILAAVGVVLLIACSNVASLLLTRSLNRQREFTVRSALGAGAARLMRQLMTESIVLASLGGVVGICLAEVIVYFVKVFGPSRIPRLSEASLDIRVLLFAFSVTLFTGVLFGLAPALSTTRENLVESLKEGGQRAGSNLSTQKTRNSFLVSQIALALVLVVAAGLLTRTLYHLLAVNPGFRGEHSLTFELSLPAAKYSGQSHIVSVYQETLRKLRAIPGVQAAGVTELIPLDGATESTAIRFSNARQVTPSSPAFANYTMVSPGYFAAVGTRILHGRSFLESDSADSLPVAIISSAMAEKYWPGQDPVGKQVAPAGAAFPLATIVGVVADVKRLSIRESPPPEMYVPYTQKVWPSLLTMDVVLRTAQDPGSITASARKAIHSIDPDLPLSNVRTLAAIVSNSMSEPLFAALLLGAFGVVALLLATIGMYGVISYSVTQRTQEIGLRMALGAQPRNVLELVLGQGTRLAIVGITVGLAAAFATTRFMNGFLYGVGALDPLTFLVVSLLLMGTVLLACYIPARRAMRVDPMVALRYE
ncbi:MAG TPA: ABC transporter permease [Candidatus Acidoferrales bacterium]|nr:ABC transporter permease [Candidatus Acidoferrales bacterium]